MNNMINYHVQAIAPGIWAIDEFSMAYIYVIQGRDSALVLDTGTGTSDLKSVVEQLVTTPYTVVVTHAHMDHVGGIGQFDTIHVHRADLPCFDLPEEINPIGIYKRKKYCERAIAAYGQECLPFDPEGLSPVDLSRIRLVSYEEGAVFDLGGRTLEAIHIPAHSRGSCCFLDREDRILFAGDSFSEILLLPLGGTDQERATDWLRGARKVQERAAEFDCICAGHYCPLDRQSFDDLFACAQKILDNTLSLEVCQVDEMLGPMYHYGRVYFSMDPENLRTRDYSRMKNPRHY